MGKVSITSFLLIIFFASFTLAADKVVVVPLSSAPKPAGENGQVQYNDNGTTGGAELYYAKDSGRVGIGTANINTKLVVHGDGNHWSSGFISLKNDDHDAGIRFYDGESTNRHHIFNSNSENDLLRIVPADNWNQGIALQQSGNVGIGTKTPTTKLEVSSVIRSTPTDAPGICDLDTEGAMYYDASANEPCFCDGTAWRQFDGGGGC